MYCPDPGGSSRFSSSMRFASKISSVLFRAKKRPSPVVFFPSIIAQLLPASRCVPGQPRIGVEQLLQFTAECFGLRHRQFPRRDVFGIVLAFDQPVIARQRKYDSGIAYAVIENFGLCVANRSLLRYSPTSSQRTRQPRRQAAKIPSAQTPKRPWLGLRLRLRKRSDNRRQTLRRRFLSRHCLLLTKQAQCGTDSFTSRKSRKGL